MVKSIFILGGEPLDHPANELLPLLAASHATGLPVWLFTRYRLHQIPPEVLHYCDYVKTGRFIPKFQTQRNIQYGIRLASSNQHIRHKGANY